MAKSGRFNSTASPAAGPDVSGRIFLVQASANVEVGGSDLVAGQGFEIPANTPTAIGTEHTAQSNLNNFFFVGAAEVQYLRQL